MIAGPRTSKKVKTVIKKKKLKKNNMAVIKKLIV